MQASSATPIPHTDNVIHQDFSNTIFVLSFDASKWPHPEVINELKDLTGRPISEVTGVLGAFASINKARKVGWRWAMRNLLAAEELYQIPLPYEMEEESLPGEWKRSSWVGNKDTGLEYILSDHARQIALSATITTVKIDEDIDNESYTTQGDQEKRESDEEGGVEGIIEHTKSEEEADEGGEHDVSSVEGMDSKDEEGEVEGIIEHTQSEEEAEEGSEYEVSSDEGMDSED